MKLPKLTVSTLSLVAANLAPLGGVFFLGWDAGAIVLFYWMENVVVGFYNVLRMATVKVEKPLYHLGKLFTIPFFYIHFGGFCAVHGVFVLVFLGLAKGGDFLPSGQLVIFLPSGNTWPGYLVFVQLLVSVIVYLWQNRPPGFEWPVLALFLSHGVSFVQNHFLKGEYASLTTNELMTRPYRRIVLLHITLLAGGLPVMLLGSPVPLLVILVALKTGMDLWLHAKSHRAAQGEAPRRNGPLALPQGNRVLD